MSVIHPLCAAAPPQGNKGRMTNLPLPRFVTLKGSLSNMRAGPGKDHSLVWVYQKKGLPIEIIDEYDYWRRVRDMDGSEGWMHQSILSGRRMIIILEGSHNIYFEPNLQSDVIALVDGGVLAQPVKCTQRFCYIRHRDFDGWIPKNVIYGVYNHEVFGD